jgi:hypothetical protein
MDFIGPLPVDNSFNYILTMTDRLGSDIRLVLTRVDIAAAHLTSQFFEHWYCENGLPLEIISDRDKLFTSKFWKALHILTGVNIKMSTAYHPQSDGASEHTNKTLVQMIRYYVERNQKGWAKALPKIHFQLMNTVNASTGVSGFELKMGHSPHVIPPIVPSELPPMKDCKEELEAAMNAVNDINTVVEEVKDNLLRAKMSQAMAANSERSAEDIFAVGDKVMLQTKNRRHEYKKKGGKRVAKFFPRWDGPYTVTAAKPESSNCTAYITAHN